MNRIFTLVSAVLLSASLWAQTPPQNFSYQAVVRGANNALVAKKQVGMKISLLQGSETGTAVYVETHTPTSNENGLVGIAIGAGSIESGTFATIDWSKGPYFVKTETDPSGGTSYSLITTSQLLSVPYALYAANSQPGTPGADGKDGTNGLNGAPGAKGDKGDAGADGINGTPGAKGDKGDAGTDGINGTSGAKGEKGDAGADGTNGATGAKGDKGDAGTDGLNGATGVKGDKGDTGADGIYGAPGAKGDKGDAGANGTNGTNGTSGAKGDKGDTGADGTDGLNGAPGAKGDKGDAGADGTNGATGAKGDKGDAGTDGINGQSAYQLAVAKGFVGLEEEWIASLKGASGAQGTFPSGTTSGEIKYWDGSSWVSLIPGNQGQGLSFCDGFPTWTTNGICPGKITALNCAGVSMNGSLTNGVVASNVSFVITYTGGNNGPYSSQSISSTGVIGLTTSLQAGSFDTGNGSLTFTVSGTPSSAGNALFSLNIAGQVCSISMIVQAHPTSGYGSDISDTENNTYKTVYIGNQQWMAENLKVSKYNDGTAIPNITDNTQWSNLWSGSWAYYNNDAANDAKYGKLYNSFAISPTTNGNKNVCPTGWHVPTDAELKVLTDYLGGASVVGGKMKEVSTTSWNSPNTNATNTSLFTGLPGGLRNSDGSYSLIGQACYLWSSTNYNNDNSWFRTLYYTNINVFSNFFFKRNGLSVRCLRD